MNGLKRIVATSRLTCLALLLSTLALVGCAGQALSDAASEPPPRHNYLIGSGDSLSISVWRNPDASTSVTVRPDGKITIPFIEDMPAAGKSSSQLARDIEKTLSKYIQDPIVTIMVTGFVGPYSEQIRIIGQATRPQALPYRDNMTMLDVLIAVGGITEFAAGNQTYLIRNLNGKQQQFIVRLDDLIKDGDISANISMRPGDIIVVPESFF